MERWTGEYAYDKSGLFKSLLSQISGASRNTVAFSADLVFDGNRLSGTMKEVNTFLTVYGEDSPRYLISNISGYIDGNEIIFEGFDLAPIRRALNSCVNIFNLYGCF